MRLVWRVGDGSFLFAVSVASVPLSHFALACVVLGVAVIGVFRTHFQTLRHRPFLILRNIFYQR